MTLQELKDWIISEIKKKLEDPNLSCSDLAYLSEALCNLERSGYETESTLEPIRVNKDPVYLSGPAVNEQLKQINKERENQGLPPV